MPEVREVRDMWRKVQAALSFDPKPFQIQYHPEHMRKKGSFVNRTGAQVAFDRSQILLSKDHVQYHGKSILIQMPGLDVLEVQFFLQGHLLLIGNQEMEEVEQHWARFPAGYDGQIHPHIGLCLRSVDPGSKSIIFLDHLKFMTFELWRRNPFEHFKNWKPPGKGPDPTKQYQNFHYGVKNHVCDSKLPIHEYMGKHQDVFCGLGQCLINEVLHLAKVHPLTPACRVFGQGTPQSQRTDIGVAVMDLVALFTSDKYQKNIPATSSSKSAFDVNKSCTAYIVGITKVYRKTNFRGTKISREHYKSLLDLGKVDKVEQSIRNSLTPDVCVPVFMCRWEYTPRKWKYCYTVIKDLPQGSEKNIEMIKRLHNGKLTSAYEKKALKADSKIPDIGISSFHYLLNSVDAVRQLVGRPANQNSGLRGKPNKNSLPNYLTYGEKQDLVRQTAGVTAIEDLAQAEDGVLDDEVQGQDEE